MIKPIFSTEGALVSLQTEAQAAFLTDERRQGRQERNETKMRICAGAIFDMDGTLIDSLVLWEIIWERLGKSCLGKDGFRPKTEDDKAVRTMTLKGAMDFIHEAYEMGPSGEALLALTNEIIADFYANEVEMKAGALSFLKALKEKGVKMCIASATDLGLVRLALARCDIEKYFVAVLSCADSGKGKDSPDIYERALSALGTPLEDTCVYEDSLVALRTASAMGLQTVGIYDKNNYGHKEMQEIATVYVGEGETLEKLL